MSVREFTVNVTPQEALDAIEIYVVEGNISGTLVDRYVRRSGEQEVHVIILEKYYLYSAEDSHLGRWRDECGLVLCSAGVQTPAEQKRNAG